LAPKLRKTEVWETTTADSLLQKPLLGKTPSVIRRATDLRTGKCGQKSFKKPSF